LKAEATSTVFIGNDTAEDIACAQRAGIRAIYLDERGDDVNSAVTKLGPVVSHALPTLDALVACLHTFGWKGGER
jgi:FMN phosphatase YigB (HAD superfamily)